MSIQFLNTEFPTPIILASSPLTETTARILKAEKNGAGGAILKSCCSYTRKNNYDSRKVVFSKDGSCYYAASSFEREILTAEEGLSLFESTVKKCSIPIIPSITALSLEPEDWLPLCLAFQNQGAKIIQLDFFYLKTFLSQPDFSVKFRNLLDTLTRTLSCQIMPKLNVDLPADFICQLLSSSGIKGVSLLDSVRVPSPINENTPILPFASTSCFGSWQLPLSLHYACIAKQYGLEICGGGGITNTNDVNQMLCCGASLIQVASAILLNGFEKLKELMPQQQTVQPMVTSAISSKYQIDADKCINCHKCTDLSVWCDAIIKKDTQAPYINSDVCEGCGWCTSRCPVDAITSIN